MTPTKIEISHRTIIFTILLLLILWFLYQIRQILFLIFISLLLTFVLEPLVEFVEKLKVPRWLATLLIYIFFILTFGILLGGMIPPLIDQTSVLISYLPSLFRQIDLLGIDQNIINNQLSQLGSIPVNLAKFLFGIFSNIATVLILLVFAFYFLQERKKIDEYLSSFFVKTEKERIKMIVNKIEQRLGGWVRGEMLLMSIVGFLSYIGFRLLGIEAALPLAIIAGLLEIIPNIGPTVATVPAVLAGLAISPFHALGALSWGFLVQQVENHLIVPKVMQKAAGVNPLVTLISLSIGYKVAGLAGTLLAVPIFLTLEVIFPEIIRSK